MRRDGARLILGGRCNARGDGWGAIIAIGKHEVVVRTHGKIVRLPAKGLHCYGPGPKATRRDWHRWRNPRGEKRPAHRAGRWRGWRALFERRWLAQERRGPAPTGLAFPLIDASRSYRLSVDSAPDIVRQYIVILWPCGHESTWTPRTSEDVRGQLSRGCARCSSNLGDR